ncbi:hypothetical protein SAMN05216275_14170 [Streptosporangium canum]|uniref:Uncharacterized protein n=1 Tax=Streptosporangium canum TaxID=324952 RepID=A0A1I4DLC5_9ACTN|nr:hypothetical protein [Streptosporangium canum]SFK92711.1 hypothetical protein SAMN05216275_14170 [Streptosporangium canum]
MARRTYTSAPAKPQPGVVLPYFTLDGVTFTCTDQLALLDLSEFARLASQGLDSDSPDGIAAIGEFLTAILGDVTYQRFRRHCRQHKTDGETIVAIIGDLIQDFSARPTSRPSDSSDGPPSTEGTARVVSLSRGTVEEVPAETVTAEPELVRYG